MGSCFPGLPNALSIHVYIIESGIYFMPPLRSLLCQIMPKTYNDFAHALLSNYLPFMYNCDMKWQKF